MTAFLKAALEDTHPVVRQNAAGALARKLNHPKRGVLGVLQRRRNSHKNQAVNIRSNADYEIYCLVWMRQGSILQFMCEVVPQSSCSRASGQI